MKLEAYIEKGGQKLRLGYTTGSCAAAAAKAAAWMLLAGERVPAVRLKTPAGRELYLEIEDIRMTPETVSCAVRKDSGDDPDVTDGALIYAAVTRSEQPGIRIDGGEGVGRVTRPGLDQPVGSAAINSTPRRMIEAAVREAACEAAQEAAQRSEAAVRPAPETDKESAGRAELQMADKEPAGQKELQVTDKEPAVRAEAQEADNGPASQTVPGFEVIISVPRGRELAAKIFNPKLGIVGGISILGTSGIVEPMSEKALLDTIRAEINVRREEKYRILPAAPGNYGKTFFMEKYGFSLDTAVTTSNFIYDTVRMAREAGFEHMLFVGHIGKLVKVAGGIRNTHSQYGDHRMEILSQILADVCAREPDTAENGTDVREQEPVNKPPQGKAEAESVSRMLAQCVTTDDAVRILREHGLDRVVLAEMTCRIRAVMQEWAEGAMRVEVVVFSNVYGELGRTEGAEEYIRILKGHTEGGHRCPQ